MTYIELVNRFWALNQVKVFSSIDVAVYFLLLNECNIRRWLNPFELQTRYFEYVFGISRKSIGEARNRLKQRGLIDFIEGKGKSPATYLIKEAEVNKDELVVVFNVSTGNNKINNIGNNTGNISVTTKVTSQKQHPESYIIINKDIRKRSKKKIKENDDASQSEMLFSEREMKEVRSRSKTESDPPPTLEEVLRYFLSKDADKRLENWEESAKRFYDNFSAVDWRDKYNRRITRWDSRANNWILDEQRGQSNEATQRPYRTGLQTKLPPTPGCGLVED